MRSALRLTSFARANLRRGRRHLISNHLHPQRGASGLESAVLPLSALSQRATRARVSQVTPNSGQILKTIIRWNRRRSLLLYFLHNPRLRTLLHTMKQRNPHQHPCPFPFTPRRLPFPLTSNQTFAQLSQNHRSLVLYRTSSYRLSRSSKFIVSEVSLRHSDRQ
jgi:hypothetical protein